MIDVARGLVIREPWIDLILSGRKTWEMRSTAPSWRGWFGLIRKGSGEISGIARLADVGRALSPDEMVETFGQHRIPEAMIRSGEAAKWTTPWILADIQMLRSPVRYRHPNGAITLFTLELETYDAVAAQLDDAAPAPTGQPALSRAFLVAGRPTLAIIPAKQGSRERLPMIDEASGPGLFLGATDVTAGNLKHSHFYLRGFIDRFPQQLVGGRDRTAPILATVETDSGRSTVTDICSTHRFSRDRSWTGAFFESAGARPGDRVMVRELAPYRYQVSLCRSDATAIDDHEV